MSERKDEYMIKEIDDVIETEQKERRALNILLDKQNQKKSHLHALKTHMGKTVSYVSVVTLGWVSARVHYARDLPIFKKKKKAGTGHIKIDAETVFQIRQREPDWSRQYLMVRYLLERNLRKFPPILVVAHQKWAHTPEADEWTGGRATRNSIDETILDTDGIHCDVLADENTWFYALDGQHRLMAIQGLAEFLTKGELYARDKQGKQTSKKFSLEDLSDDMEKRGVDPHALNSQMAEKIGIEIVPAVIKGESEEESLRRLRSVFVYVNRYAKSLTKSELALLDEDNGFAVVARDAAANHSLLKERVDTGTTHIPEHSTAYTTMEILVQTAESYLGRLPEFRHWKTPANELALRPEDDDLVAGQDQFHAYLDALCKITSHNSLMQGAADKEVQRWRRKKDGEDNILFRPIAQLALAEAVGILVVDREQNIGHIFSVLAAQESKGLLKLHDTKAPWFGVLVDDNGKMRRQKSHQTLCAKLFVHVLGGGTHTEGEQEKLREEFAKARVVQRPSDDQQTWKAMNLDGKPVSLEKVALPTPWK